jgi:hypothetical protein
MFSIKPGFTDGIGAQRLPFISVLRRIDNHGMGVYLGLLRAVCVIKPGDNQIVGQDCFRHAVFLYPC